MAVDVLSDDGPRIEEWDLPGEKDVWGFSVGCNGVITVLLEPLDESYRPVVDAPRADESIGVATVVRTEDVIVVTVGDREHYSSSDEFAENTNLPASIAEKLEEPTRKLATAGKSKTDAGSVDVFVDGVRPSPISSFSVPVTMPSPLSSLQRALASA